MITRDNPVIDQDDLHNEIIRLAYLIMEVASDIANKIADRDLLFSRIARKLRREDPKISQAKLESQIKEDGEYIEVEREIGLFKAQLDGLKVAVKGVEIDVELIKIGYCSSPVNPNDRIVGKVVNEFKTKAQEQKQKEVLNKNRGEKNES